MTEWVSQSDARKLLAALGDKVSQPGLSQYLSGHGEIAQQDDGPGRAKRVDWEALKRSRATRQARGPSSAPTEQLFDAAPSPAPKPDPVKNELADRRARADTDRAESDARRSKILADEAEGRVIPRQQADAVTRAAGVALLKAFEEHRRRSTDAIRAAKDVREADLAMRNHEKAVRASLATVLTEFAALADTETAAAQ